MNSIYQKSIRDELVRHGHIGIDPRHIEAFMRLEYSTLDGLSSKQFKHEIFVCLECVMEGGIPNAEKLAQSFGL